MNKVVIFDIDGTLINSLPDISYNLNLTLEKFNRERLTEKAITQLIGNGARQLVADAFGGNLTEEEIDERLNYFGLLYSTANSKTIVYEDIYELLEKLQKMGFLLAIVTNKPQVTTENTCKKFFNDVNFSAVVGQSQTVKCKPDPTATINLLKSINVLPENAYFVGDGETDYLTSKNAGVKGISCLWGYRTKEQLQKVGATVFASKPSDILNIIARETL